jgi:segregation and condensation protein A
MEDSDITASEASQPKDSTSNLQEEKIDLLIETPELTWRDILYEVIKGMNPWEIDISELATRYTRKVEEMQEMNFRIPANVVLVSSVLLRMKADILRPSEKDPFLDGKDAFAFLFSSDLANFTLMKADLAGKEYAIQPLLTPARPLTRRVTAEELIAAIQKAMEEKSEKKYRLESDGGRRMLVVATDWDAAAAMEEVYKRIIAILSEREFALFSQLAGTRDEIIRVFMSILHLSNQRKVSLQQEHIYEEIYIRQPSYRI